MPNIEPKKVEAEAVTKEQQLMQEFVNKYSALCEEYGFQIVVTPVFVARDDGTFSVKLNSSIGKISKQ